MITNWGAIRALLEKLTDIELIAEASDGREAIRMVEKHKPHVLLTDIAMPVLNGLELTYVLLYADRNSLNLKARYRLRIGDS